MQTVAWSFMVGKSTAQGIIKETCEVLWKNLAPVYLKTPTKESFKQIAQVFEEVWNFPFCLGAIDGKHISIQAPNKSGTEYFNYKKFFSIVLLAACDAKYRFTMVDIGAHGSLSDGAVFKDSEMGKALDRGNLPIPGPKYLPGSTNEVPYVFVADEAFPLKSYIMRPFPGRGLSETQKIFNYRLSRARRTIENSFGILVSRWRLFRTSIIADVRTVEKMVGAAICLHNFLMSEEESYTNSTRLYCSDQFLRDLDANSEVQQSQLQDITSMSGNNQSNAVKKIRQHFSTYFVSEVGEMGHQYEYVNRGCL